MKPILFNTEMVQAILEGRKTVTRRVIKPQPSEKLKCIIPHEVRGKAIWTQESDIYDIDTKEWRSFEVGDILYVRETWCNVKNPEYEPEYYYLADCLSKEVEDYDPSDWKWRPSIYMPKEAARIFLKVIDVRVERLRDITEEQAIKEGFRVNYKLFENSTPAMTATQAFMWIWQMLYDRGQYPWISNPWVWVIEFEKTEA